MFRLSPHLHQITLLPLFCLSMGFGAAALAQSIPRPTLESFEQVVTRMPAVSELQLTPQQQQQLIQIIAEAQLELEAVMTEPQKQQFWAALNQGERVRDAIKGASLSFGQLWQLRPVMQSTQIQVEAVLTPEQQQQVEDLRQANR